MILKLIKGFIPNLSGVLKWAAILALITMLGLTFSAYSDQGKLESALASQNATIERTNAERAKDKKTFELIIATSKTRENKLLNDAKRLNAYKRRALYAEKELSKIVSTGDIGAINARLCDNFDRIEGNNLGDREDRCNASKQTSATTGTYYKIDSQSVENLLVNTERIASTIDQCFVINKQDDTLK